MRANGFTSKYVQIMEGNFANIDEAFILLDLIEAEFNSDPLSVQCFDLRIVERVKFCNARRREYKKQTGL